MKMTNENILVFLFTFSGQITVPPLFHLGRIPPCPPPRDFRHGLTRLGYCKILSLPLHCMICYVFLQSRLFCGENQVIFIYDIFGGDNFTKSFIGATSRTFRSITKKKKNLANIQSTSRASDLIL